MKKLLSGLLLLVPMLHSCGPDKTKTNWNATLDHEGVNPYDTKLAWEAMQWYFPNAKRELISRNFRYTSIDQRMLVRSNAGPALLVMNGLDYYLNEDEWAQVKQFAQYGNEVLIVCSTLDNKIESELKCAKAGGGESQPLNQYNDGTSNRNILSLLPDTTKKYGFTGRSLNGTFAIGFKEATVEEPATAQDSASTASTSDDETTYSADGETGDDAKFSGPEILGYGPTASANFLRYSIGSGHISLHAAPLAFSNYFLLQDGNRKYLDGIWHSFPSNITYIYWNDYYRRSTEKSSLNVLWRYPATRWALIIAIGTLLTYVLIGLKRRQRIIPIIQPPENASVSFAETIGRLYFNKGDHANLAEKMIQHFLEWVRATCYIDTARLNEPFVQQLAAKSGQSTEQVAELVNRIHEVRLGSTAVTQEYLFLLYRSFESFYNHQRS